MIWWIMIAKVLFSFTLGLTILIFLVWGERKVLADFQQRIGPDRAGPWGMLQTVADGLKLFFKEQLNPTNINRFAFELAPFLAAVPAFLLLLVVPWAKPISVVLNGQFTTINFAALDLNVGLLFILGMSSLGVYAIVLAGWSSGSKYPLIGGVRGAAQAISYEAAIGLSMVSVVLWTAAGANGTGLGAMSLSEIVTQQGARYWNIIPLFPAFVIFLIAIFAETNRAPFDLVEAEQEIVAGFHTEYSGMRFAMFFLAEYMNMFTMSAITVTLFMGGWSGPGVDRLNGWAAVALSFGYFMAKIVALLFVFIWVRASFPRMRYDQLMDLGWKRLIPASVVWLGIVAVVVSVQTFGLGSIGGGV